MSEGTQPTGRIRSFGRALIVSLLVLALLGAVFWLVSERNARQWFLVQEDGQLVVKKGLWFPTGRSNYRGVEASLAYAPLRPPPGQPLPPDQRFDDRTGLDQSIYEHLSRWAGSEITGDDPQRLERALAYLTRAEQLPGISAAQREGLRKLRGESGFFEARALLDRGAEELRLAREKLRLASETPSRHAADALLVLRQLEPLVEEVVRTSRAASSATAKGAAEAPPSGAAPATTR